MTKRRRILVQCDLNLNVFFVGALLISLAACTRLDIPSAPRHDQLPKAGSAPQDFGLLQVSFPEVPGWRADDHSAALKPFLSSCEKIAKLAPDQSLGKSNLMGTIGDWLAICRDAKLVRPGNKVDAQYFFESRFRAYMALSSNGSTGTFTGYYEPELRGAWKPNTRFRVPVYARPKDIVVADLGKFDDRWQSEKIVGRLAKGEFLPYYDRAAIETGALNGRQLEILWVDDPVDAFFLHIQGSGRIRLPDGTHIRLGYAGRNGRRYTAVGRELVAAGILRLKEVTMPSIRQWMEENPVAAQAVMRKNRSFIFFKVLKGTGPIGAQGIELTPGRSLAIDRKFIPFGIPIWLDTSEPGTKPVKPLRRLVIAQDTGSAIKGPIRGDFFWGHGNSAAEKAGVMNQKGRYFLLLPRKLNTAAVTE